MPSLLRSCNQHSVQEVLVVEGAINIKRKGRYQVRLDLIFHRTCRGNRCLRLPVNRQCTGQCGASGGAYESLNA